MTEGFLASLISGLIAALLLELGNRFLRQRRVPKPDAAQPDPASAAAPKEPMPLWASIARAIGRGLVAIVAGFILSGITAGMLEVEGAKIGDLYDPLPVLLTALFASLVWLALSSTRTALRSFAAFVAAFLLGTGGSAALQTVPGWASQFGSVEGLTLMTICFIFIYLALARIGPLRNPNLFVHSPRA